MNHKVLDAACKGLQDAIRRSTVGIVSGSGQLKGKGIGTGTLITWEGHHVLLTAAHVVVHTGLADLRFLFPSPEPPIEIGDCADVLTIDGVPTRNCDEYDLARQ